MCEFAFFKNWHQKYSRGIQSALQMIRYHARRCDPPTGLCHVAGGLPDGLAVLPQTLKGGAAKAVVAKLTALGFLKEVRVKRGEPSWRTDEEEKPVGLKITKAGSAAIGVEDEGKAEAEPAPAPKRRRRKPGEPPSGGPRQRRQAPRGLEAGAGHRPHAAQEPGNPRLAC
jgi:hypothetical protein